MSNEVTAKSFDYSKLSGKIIEVCGSWRAFSARMNLSEPTISKKKNGKIEWTQCEMSNACDVLGIEKSEIPSYFFSVKS